MRVPKTSVRGRWTGKRPGLPRTFPDNKPRYKTDMKNDTPACPCAPVAEPCLLAAPGYATGTFLQHCHAADSRMMRLARA
jgi:hypothetical protein